MKNSVRSILAWAIVGFAAVALTGCSPAAKKSRYLEQANRYYTDGKYDEAEIDYKNVLQIENLNPQAITQLGKIYFEQGKLARSFVYVQKATELQPDNLEMRVKLGQLYFAFGQTDDARTQANYVLERRPENTEAILLLADTVRSSKDIDAARARLKSLPASASGSAAGQLALGIFESREGRLQPAEEYFQKALQLDPKLVEAHTVLALVYRMKHDLPKADAEYKIAYDLAPARSPHRLQYAQYKIQTQDYAAGRKLLEGMIAATPDYLPAMIVLAQLDAVEKKYDDASALISKVLSREPTQPEAMLLAGRLALAKGNSAAAITETEKMLRAYPKSAQAHHQLALAYLETGQVDKAIASLNQALTFYPGFVEAALLLANLDNRKGDFSSAIVLTKQLIERRPDMAQAWLLLADAYRGQGNFADALGVYKELDRRFPNSAETAFRIGQVYVQQKKFAEARASFDRSLELAPGNIIAIEQLIGLDVSERKFDSAIQRAEALVAKSPKSAGPLILLARVYAVQKDFDRTEAALKKAIAVQPESPDAYYMLAGLYFEANQSQKALSNLKELLDKNPQNLQAWMISGILEDQLKNYPAARDAYEKVIALNPKAAIALNNLAYLYAEKLNELDKGLEIALRARELQPQDPHVGDTLGWIYFRKHDNNRALPLLREAAGKTPESAEIQYHFGMSQYMAGDESGARDSLKRALGISSSFAGAADAAKTLAFLNTPNSASRAELEKLLASNPGDTIALSRLTLVYEREGALDKAFDLNQAAFKANPSNVKVMLNLARLYAEKKDMDKAMEMAKAARKAAPIDADVAYGVGKLAFQTGDYVWGASLLQEAARRSPDDPEIAYDNAVATYAVGRVDDAVTSLQSALDSKAGFSRADRARDLLAWIALAANPGADAAAKVDRALKSDASYVPALMVSAALSERSGNDAATKAALEKALARYPDFLPAKRGLANYYANHPENDDKGYDLATTARNAYPNDPVVAKALGILSYRRSELPRAVSLLTESAASRTDDAEIMFYLGMAQAKLKKTAEAKAALGQALTLGLKGDQANDAKKTLAGLK